MTTLKLPAGWRRLGDTETIKEGDKLQTVTGASDSLDSWQKIDAGIGKNVGVYCENGEYVVIRKIEAKPAPDKSRLISRINSLSIDSADKVRVREIVEELLEELLGEKLEEEIVLERGNTWRTVHGTTCVLVKALGDKWAMIGTGTGGFGLWDISGGSELKTAEQMKTYIRSNLTDFKFVGKSTLNYPQ